MIKRQKLETIQALRAVAAILVVILHSVVHLNARGIIDSVPPAFEFGRSGVDIFFVISGFIMTYVTRNAFQSGKTMDFLIRRAIRIVPIYWFFTLTLTGLMLVASGQFSSGKVFGLQHLIASLSFVPYPNSVGNLRPILGPGWTLNYEMYFYLLVGLLLFLPKRWLITGLTGWFGLTFLVGQLIALPDQLAFYTRPILFEFLLGVIAANIYLSREHIVLPKAFILLGAMLLLSTIFINTGVGLRHLKWGIPGFLLVLGLVFYEKHGTVEVPKLLVALGDSSYSLYLTHIFSINLTGFIWRKVFDTSYLPGFVVAAILASLVFGHIAHLVIEKPITRLLNRRYAEFKQG